MGSGGVAAAVCCLCFGAPTLITIIILISLASKSNYSPSCTINDLYIPALNTRLPIFNSSSSPAATFIFFDLQLEKKIQSDGVRFKFFNSTLVFYYARNPIANYTLPEKTAQVRDLVETRGMPWSDAIAAVSGGSKAAFTVEFAARVRVKRDVGRDLNKEVLLRADVEVNGSGERVRKKDIKLKSISKDLRSD